MILLNNVRFDYPALPMHFHFHLSKGEKAAIIGASGAGKSTLLNLIAGFAQPSSGDIILNGENHSRTAPHRRPVSILFQENNLFPHLTVAENIALGLKPDLRLNTTERAAVAAAAEAVDLHHFLPRKPEQLSGGQNQRVALARCLLRNKPILLLDEPFSALDPQLRQDMLALIDRLCDQKQLTLLLITHQPSELKGHIHRILEISQGEIHTHHT